MANNFHSYDEALLRRNSNGYGFMSIGVALLSHFFFPLFLVPISGIFAYFSIKKKTKYGYLLALIGLTVATIALYRSPFARKILAYLFT